MTDSQSLYTGLGSVPIPDPTVLTEQRVGQAIDTLRRELAHTREIIEAKITQVADHSEFIRTEHTHWEEERKEALRLAAGSIQNGLTKAELTLQQGLEAAEKRVNEKLAIQADTLQNSLHQMSLEIDIKVSHLQALQDEKFSSIATQFQERQVRREREYRDTKLTQEAAFAAQKELSAEQNKSNSIAIDKSEKATAETLNKQSDLFNSTTDSLDSKIEDAKQIVNKIDTRLTTIESRGVAVRETQTQSNWTISATISVVSTLISLAALFIVILKMLDTV